MSAPNNPELSQWFQSAPAPVGAGDPRLHSRMYSVTSFQSAPAPVGAGDTRSSRTRQPWGCFNPRPLP